MKIHAGSRCPCHPARRYVRFVIPAVPGCEPVISCRDVDAAQGGVKEHPIPADAEFHVRVAGVGA